LNKEEGGTAVNLVEDLIKKLLAEHDRSALLRSIGGRGLSDRSNGAGRAEEEEPASTSTNPPVSRRRRHAIVVEKPEKIELSSTELDDTQAQLPETGDEERGLEL
jgi:hypothetical protein